MNGRPAPIVFATGLRQQAAYQRCSPLAERRASATCSAPRVNRTCAGHAWTTSVPPFPSRIPSVPSQRAHAWQSAQWHTTRAPRAGQPFLAGDAPTLADIAMYTYTAHAPEGSVDLAPHPHVRAWLGRVEALPGFVPMRRTPVGLAG